MGRPPNAARPLWLTGERQQTKKYFVVPIPPVDEQVHSAIQSRIASTQPWLVQRAQLGEAESQLVGLRATQEEASLKVDELQQAREQALGEIEALRQSQLEDELKLVEERLRQDFQQSQDSKQSTLNRELDEFLQQEPPPAVEEQVVAEEPPPAKRIKVEEPAETEKDEKPPETNLEDGELDEEEGQILEDAVAAGASQSESSAELKPSQRKKQELENLSSQMDGLTETKHQLIWLFKQVIKAEQKRKAKPGDDGK